LLIKATVPGKYNHSIGPCVREAVVRLCCIVALQMHVFGGTADVDTHLAKKITTLTSFYASPCQYTTDAMSGGQDVLGMVAGGASLLSLSVKLAESAATLKRLYHDARNAPEALVDLAHGIETVSLDLRLIERNWCLEWCQRHAADIQQLTDQLSLKLGRVLLSGKGDIVVREQILDTLLHDLNHAQTTLQQTLEEFHEQETDRRWRLRATGGVRSHRGHEYSNIAVRDHARLHIGDVYMYGPPSQQTVANPEIYASTRHKRTGDSQRPIRGSEDGSYQGNQRSTAMRRAIQTYTDNVTREFGLAVHRLIQELEEVSPRLISSDRLE
jgi:hypothetical protein